MVAYSFGANNHQFAGRAADPLCGRQPFRRIAARRWASHMPVSGWMHIRTQVIIDKVAEMYCQPAAAVDTKHKFAIPHDLPFRLFVICDYD
jgi:hypothetical protein